MKEILFTAFVTLTMLSGPVFAIVDDGSGCGCIRPCIEDIINR
jgi:hypothetical protein